MAASRDPERMLPERILIVRLSHLGDVVCALGLFHALHEAFPRATIGWVVQPAFAGLLRGLPGLDRLFLFERHGGLMAWPRLRSELRRFRPDLTVDAQGNLKSAAVTALSGAARRAGLARSDWREPLGRLVLTERASATTPDEHHTVFRTLRLARHVAPGASSPPRTDPALADAEIARGEQLLHDMGAVGEGGVLLHVSSVEDVRAWPLERHVELIDLLLAEGRRVLVVSGPQETAEGETLAERFPGVGEVSHWTGQRGLRELASVFAVAAARSWTYVGADSGPMHLAWACGLPVVLLEGPQDGARTGPWPVADATGAGPHSHPGHPGPHQRVRARTPPECAPCRSRRCGHPEGRVCLLDIEPSRVVQAVVGGAERPSGSALPCG